MCLGTVVGKKFFDNFPLGIAQLGKLRLHNLKVWYLQIIWAIPLFQIASMLKNCFQTWSKQNQMSEKEAAILADEVKQSGWAQHGDHFMQGIER